METPILSPSGMLQKVARALAAASCVGPPDAEWIDANWPNYVENARAALEAMRTPTEDVASAMNDLASAGETDWRELHEAFVNAALNPEAAADV